jgi:hypothetical protein
MTAAGTPHERPPPPLDLAEVDAEGGEPSVCVAAELVHAIALRECALALEGACEGDADLAGEMVEAGAGVAEELASGRLLKRPDRWLRCDDRQRLDGRGDGGVGQVVVAVATALLRRQETAVDETLQMLAGGRGGVAGPRGKSVGEGSFVLWQVPLRLDPAPA